MCMCKYKSININKYIYHMLSSLQGGNSKKQTCLMDLVWPVEKKCIKEPYLGCGHLPVAMGSEGSY